MGRAFSWVIDEATGRVTAAIATDGSAVAVFGACTPLESRRTRRTERSRNDERKNHSHRRVLIAPVAGAAMAQTQAAASPHSQDPGRDHERLRLPDRGPDARAAVDRRGRLLRTGRSQNTGSDPFALSRNRPSSSNNRPTQAQQQIAQKGKGAGAKGAVGGAAAGALIGEIASDDAGKGAAWGALAGAIIARRRTEQAKAQASQQVEQQSQQAQQATAEQIENFKKAFSVCLEAKKYMVKY